MAAGRPRRKRRWRPQPRLHLPADRGLPAGRGVGKSIASHRHRTGIATFQLSPSGLIRGPRAGDGTVALDARVKPEHDDSADDGKPDGGRSEEHTSELQSLMRISYAVFCLKKKTKRQ